MELLDDQTLKEIEAIPETPIEKLKLEVLAYELGVALLSKEYPLLVEEEEEENCDH